MADKPDDALLRGVRNELVGDIITQAKAMGAPLPNIRATEAFVDPIMRKIEVDADKESRAILPAPTTPQDRVAGKGEWYGEAGHSPQIGGEGSRVQGDAEVRSEQLGEYEVGKGGKLKPVNGAPVPKGPTVLELIIKKLLSHPAWKEQITIALKSCDKHMSAATGCTLCERRETRLVEIVGKARATFSKQRDRRIVVAGR